MLRAACVVSVYFAAGRYFKTRAQNEHTLV